MLAPVQWTGLDVTSIIQSMDPRAIQTNSRSYRWEDFLELGEDDLRELIDGELLEVEVPTKLHEWIVSFLIAELVVWSRVHGGLVLASGYKIRISDTRGVMPDVQFFRKGHEARGGDRGLESGAPDLVVEVVSPSSIRYERVVKLRWYSQIGVPEYWIIDPEQGTIERLVLDGESYRIAGALTEEDVLSPETFPGLSVNLKELFTLPGC